MEEEQESPVLFVSYVNNFLHSFFSNVEMNIINQQKYNPNGLFAHKSYNPNNFKGAVCENKGVLHCEGYDYEIMEVILSDFF